MIDMKVDKFKFYSASSLLHNRFLIVTFKGYSKNCFHFFPRFFPHKSLIVVWQTWAPLFVPCETRKRSEQKKNFARYNEINFWWCIISQIGWKIDDKTNWKYKNSTSNEKKIEENKSASKFFIAQHSIVAARKH